jgi:hypothetical protein
MSLPINPVTSFIIVTKYSVKFIYLFIMCRHNDLPWNIRKFVHSKLSNVNFSQDLREIEPWSLSKWSHTDIPRLVQGGLGGQVMEDVG